MQDNKQQTVGRRKSDEERELILSKIDLSDIRYNRLFTATLISIITCSLWAVLVNPFNNYIPESILFFSFLSLIVIPYAHKRELGLNQVGYFCYVLGIALMGTGLAYAVYISSIGEVVEEKLLLHVFEQQVDQLSAEQLMLIKQEPKNIHTLRKIKINID